jgi:uncharacterized Zn-finger protein
MKFYLFYFKMTKINLFLSVSTWSDMTTPSTADESESPISIEGDKIKCEMDSTEDYMEVNKINDKNKTNKANDGSSIEPISKHSNKGSTPNSQFTGMLISYPAMPVLPSAEMVLQLPHVCSVCGKAFKKPRGLRLHLKVHEEGKPFKCDVCDKLFARQGYLKSHMRIHTGDKPYKCQQCELSFSQSGNLQSHMRVHSGEKPFKCSVCDKQFTISSHLRIHMRIHTGTFTDSIL